VLDTREVVEVDAEDISVGGWAKGRRGRGLFICWNWAEGLGLEKMLSSTEIGTRLYTFSTCLPKQQFIWPSTFAEIKSRRKRSPHPGLPRVDGPDSHCLPAVA
jgi:hypothetical protein